MGRYIVRRLLLNVLVLWIVASLVFVTVRILPGDFVLQQVASNLELANQQEAIANAKKLLGTDQPLWRQYADFMADLAKGDLGTSYATRKSTWSELAERIPYTLELGVMIVLVAFSISIPIGIISAIKQDTWIDYVLRGFSILSVATPVFFLAVLLMLVVLKLGLFKIDIIGRPHLWTDPKSAITLFIVPALAGGITGGAGIMRLLRSQMLEVMRQDYVRTARAKGMGERGVIIRHALKNAMVPVLTVMGLTISGIIGGQIILENMFNIPGVGQFLFSRLQMRDFPPVQGTVILIAFVIVNVNLIVDVLYGWLDPRIRYS
jgi:peptide/nickel transport system permease protein